RRPGARVREKGGVPRRGVALVTGGTRGIGLGVAQCLANDGWSLALGGVRAEADVRDVLDGLRTSGADVHYCAADLGRPDARVRLLESALARFGRIDALVNNAGRAPRVRADLLAAGEDSFEEVLRTTLQGPFCLTQQVARRLVERKRTDKDAPAAIVFVTSVSAEMASPNRGEYCVSKAGLSMAAKLFAARLA